MLTCWTLPTAISPPVPARRVDVATLLLGALAFLAPFSIDVSLPGLPAIAAALHAPGGAMQWTLSAYVLSNGIGQLVWGPLSDRFGRRPVVITGIALYVVAACACALASDVRALIALRFMQGFGSCAGSVCAFAILTDLQLPEAVFARRQAYISSINNAGPLLAPIAGVAIVSTLGWRPLYGIPALLGLVVVVAAATLLPETSPRSAGGFFERYRRVIALPRTIGLATMTFALFAGYFAMISGSPFALVSQLHLTTPLFAVAFAINAGSALLGSFVASRVAGRWGAERILVVALFASSTAALANGIAGTLAPSPAAFVATFALYAFGFGLALPATFTLVLPAAGADAGVASGILGASVSLGGAVGSALSGALPFAPTVAIGLVVVLAAAAGAASYRASAGRRVSAPAARGSTDGT